MALKRRQREILKALRSLGGQATTEALAQKTGLNINGVVQTLGVLARYIEFAGGEGRHATWRIIRSP